MKLQTPSQSPPVATDTLPGQPSLKPGLLASLLLPACLLLPAFAAQGQVARNAAETDWVSREQLSAEQQEAIPQRCCGVYLQPPFPLLDAEPGSTVIEAGTAEILSGADEGMVRISGAISVLQDGFWLQAGDSGIYDQEAGTLELTGAVQVRRPGLLVTGASASLDRTAGRSVISEASYLLHEQRARGSADIIVYTDSDGIVTINNGVFSRCEPGDDTWLLRGERITLNQNSGRGSARNVSLRIADIPVLYIPYFSFPINDERSTGVLYPAISHTGSRGLDLAVPYYLNLAPNYDATLTPRLMTRRGLMLGVEGRHLSSFSSNYIDFSWLGKDRSFDAGTAAQPGSDSPPRERRWQVDYQAEAWFSERLQAEASYLAISDSDYFRDFGSSGIDDSTARHLPRDLSLFYRHPDWSLGLALYSYQELDPDSGPELSPYASLPRINFASLIQENSGLRYGLDAEYVNFDRNLSAADFDQQSIDAGVLVTGQRFTASPAVGWSWDRPGMFLRPTGRYHFSSYRLSDQGLAEKRPQRSIFSSTVDGGLILEREFDWQDAPYRQTLEPRFFYLYQQYENQDHLPLFDTTDLDFAFQQLFRDNRFSGGDRIGDANQLAITLSSRLLDQGRERARLSLGQIVHFAQRRVNLQELSPHRSVSAFIGEFSWQFSENWRAAVYQEWNPYEKSIDAGRWQFRYQSDSEHILNFNYRYRDSGSPLASIRQTDLSLLWPLAANWGMAARWHYDHDNSRNLDSMLGLQYDSCCWSVGLTARRWLDNRTPGLNSNDTGIFLQFELKGLGSVLGGRMNESITGFRSYDYAQ